MSARKLENLSPAQRAVWDGIEALIEATPSDGMAGNGRWSAFVSWQQKGVVAGMRMARLRAINSLAKPPKRVHLRKPTAKAPE